MTLKKTFFPLKNGSAGHVRMKKKPKFTFNHRVIVIYKFLSKTNIHDLGTGNTM